MGSMPYVCMQRAESQTLSLQGNLYLKAVTDSEHPEKLLSLPDFDEKGVLLTLSQNKIFMESLAEEELRILAS
jgi:tripartite-type tricarboxylate transporter receptor subunit TctC